MSGTSALKKIAARVKVLKKKNPGAKHKTLQKKAGAEYRAGKLKVKRKKPAAAKKATRKMVKRHKTTVTRKRVKTVKRTPAVKRKKTYKGRKVKVRSYKATRYKRVSGLGNSSLLPVLAVAALGVGAYLLLKPAPVTQFPPTNNPYRAQAQNTILTYATAAGLTISAIADLIEAFNKKSDAEVIAAAQSQQAFDNAFTDIFGYY